MRIRRLRITICQCFRRRTAGQTRTSVSLIIYQKRGRHNTARSVRQRRPLGGDLCVKLRSWAAGKRSDRRAVQTIAGQIALLTIRRARILCDREPISFVLYRTLVLPASIPRTSSWKQRHGQYQWPRIQIRIHQSSSSVPLSKSNSTATAATKPIPQDFSRVMSLFVAEIHPRDSCDVPVTRRVYANNLIMRYVLPVFEIFVTGRCPIVKKVRVFREKHAK